MDGESGMGRWEVNETIKKLTCRWGCTAESEFPKNVKIQNLPPTVKNVKYDNRRYLTIEDRELNDKKIFIKSCKLIIFSYCK